MVDKPLTFTYDQLAAMPLFEQYVTIACVSNEVGGNLVGNALWRGVHLRDVLGMAGVHAGATQIVGRSVDGFTVGFPTAWAMDPSRDPMIALGMNGAPLPVEHGYPARLIVPGLYGYVSATKWLAEIELTTLEAFDAYWVPLGWAKEAPILTQSRIDVPRDGAGLAAGPGRGRRGGLGAGPRHLEGRGPDRRRRLADGDAVGGRSRRRPGSSGRSAGTRRPATTRSRSGRPTARARSRPTRSRRPRPTAHAATTRSGSTSAEQSSGRATAVGLSGHRAREGARATVRTRSTRTVSTGRGFARAQSRQGGPDTAGGRHVPAMGIGVPAGDGRSPPSGTPRLARRRDPRWGASPDRGRGLRPDRSGRLFDDVIDHRLALLGRASGALADRRDVGPSVPAGRPARPEPDDPPGGVGLDDEFERHRRPGGPRSPRSGSSRMPVSTAGAIEMRTAYAATGSRPSASSPWCSGTGSSGLLVLYHETRREWPAEELELAAAFADQMASAIENARLYEATVDLAARLRAIQDLGARLNRIQDVQGIAEAIVAEARSLIDHDNIRVYRVDHATQTCEPIAFQGVFMGVEDVSIDLLRCKVGEGLTGWVAEHNEALVIGDAETDPRRVLIGPTDGPESMLLVPMAYDDRVEGVIVLAKLGRDRFSAGHEATLSIFAGHAAQAFVNADNAERVRRQQRELELQLASQRRLLEVNETLLSTLDPHAVLEMIADSLKAVVTYDSLTIYRVDREASVRRAVVARDRFADVIMDYVGPLGDRDHRLGHRPERGGPGQRRSPRPALDPDPRHARRAGVDDRRAAGRRRRRSSGTLNIGRMGDDESHFSPNEFELTKLFAGQASIALQNAEAHRAVEVRAELDALTGLRNHGAFQRELGEAIATDDASGPGGADDGPRSVQVVQRRARPPVRGRAPARGRPRRSGAPPRRRPRLPLRGRRVRGHPARPRSRPRPSRSPSGSARPWRRRAADEVGRRRAAT